METTKNLFIYSYIKTVNIANYSVFDEKDAKYCT